MNEKHPLVPIQGGLDRSRALMQLPAEPDRQANPIRTIQSILRGRYKWALSLSIIFAIAGGTIGYRLVKPIYRSWGTIQVKPVLPQVMSRTGENGLLPMFDAYVGSQVAMIKSSRVVNKALRNKNWADLDRSMGPNEIQEFNDSLSAQHPKSSELILVSFDNADPDVARRAVQSVVQSYVEIFGDSDSQTSSILESLQARRTQLSNELSSQLRLEEAITKEFGSRDLRAYYQMKMTDLSRYEQQLRELLITIQVAEKSTPKEPADQTGDKMLADDKTAQGSDAQSGDAKKQDQSEPLTADQIAVRDPLMKNYLSQREAVSRQLSQLKLTLGDNHRKVIEARSLLASIEQSIATYTEKYNNEVTEMPSTLGYGPRQDRTAVPLAQIKERYTAMLALYNKTKQDTVDLGQKTAKLDSMRNEEESIRQRLKETEARIDQLKIESSVSGRIHVLSEGDLPLKPDRDRRQGAAVAGILFGGSFGVGIILLIGSMDRRLRSLEDAQDMLSQLTMLGILPRLPDDLAEPEHAAVAAHCVHQIRTLLQIGSDAQGRRVFAVTSPGAQDGKTSLSLALGVSFAVSGSKTLLVDCDLIGGGLTLRVDTIIRRKIGQVLQREQLVTRQQVDEALQIAQESNRRLGETLIELGYLTQHDLDEALTLQEQTPVGLLDALEGEPLEECVTDTGIKSLDILPVGAAEAYDVCKVSPTTVRRLLEDIRGQYDVVIIDTGPVPGSLEASHICAEVDGVILVAARGEQRKMAEKSVNHLYAIGARVLGLVFNRAEGADVQVLSASLSDALSEAQIIDEETGETRRSPSRMKMSAESAQEASRFDPVARAVASSSNTNRNNGSKS